MQITLPGRVMKVISRLAPFLPRFVASYVIFICFSTRDRERNSRERERARPVKFMKSVSKLFAALSFIRLACESYMRGTMKRKSSGYYSLSFSLSSSSRSVIKFN